MRHRLHILLCLAAFLQLAPSCHYLDEEPYTYLDEEDVATSSNDYILPVNDAYKYILAGYNCVGNSFLDCATDDGMSTISGSAVHRLARGFINMDNAIYSPWVSCYRGIRQCLFAMHSLSNYDVKLPGKTDEETALLKEQYYNEMVCLRAYYEFILLQAYGGYPIVDQMIGFEQSALAAEAERKSVGECVEHIVSLCDEAAAHLFVKAHNDNSANGRMTKGIALAIKAKTLVYAASPLYNRMDCGNPLVSYTPGTVPEKYPAVQDRWRRAAAACADVINLCTDGRIDPSGDKAYELVSCPASADWNTTNFLTGDGSISEWILFKTAVKNTSFEKRHYPPSISRGSGGGSVPTQELVNAFTAADGSRIAEPEDGSPTVYTGRDRRFKAFIVYDGCNTFNIYSNGALATRRLVYTRTGDGSTKDGLNATTDLSTPTGYYLAKFMYPQLNFTAKSVTTQFHLWPIIRLADIYLSFAEAMTCGYDGVDVDPEGYGLTALGAVRAIRTRAGFGPEDHFYDGITTNEDFLEKVVKQERRVELCFEGQRYFDLRRWMDAERVLNKPVHGIQIDVSGDKTTYSYFEADADRTFTEKMYFHPITKSVLKQNLHIDQNPGY